MEVHYTPKHGSWWNIVVSFRTSLMSFAMLMLVVIGAIKAQKGWLLRYPGNLRLIK